MPLTSEQVHDALRTVKDPDLHKDLVTLRMVKGVQADGDDVSIHIELTTPACPLKDKIRDDIELAVKAKAEEVGTTVGAVNVEFSADVRKANERAKDRDNPLPDVKHVIAVGAGKGGVGKSTVAVNLAVGLAQFGAKVGLLDGDIYGPSVKTMLGLDDVPTPKPRGNILVPFEVHGIRSMTIGKLVPPDKPLIWRGPMAHGAFKQLATQTDWGELDYLIVDLPPGTGDVPLTLTQLLPLTGAVVVCTPQQVALDDATRAVRMFQQLGVEVLGIVENMSYFVGDDGKTYDIFGRGGAEMMAQQMNLPFLGAVPIHMELRVNCDAGEPLKNWRGNKALAEELDRLCKNLAAQISIATLSGKFVQPTLSVS
ncbi:MAG: Mrp/NBP35 family ATP-binding protein [Planctomycetes bacterium]|nr:Mrp/NBP35 family ATP-binding protein [Planctomycetota bacterium]